MGCSYEKKDLGICPTLDVTTTSMTLSFVAAFQDTGMYDEWKKIDLHFEAPISHKNDSLIVSHHQCFSTLFCADRFMVPNGSRETWGFHLSSLELTLIQQQQQQQQQQQPDSNNKNYPKNSGCCRCLPNYP